ncbi:hypothetical protein NBRC116493_28250 [Aurantivibrio infirmus]
MIPIKLKQLSNQHLHGFVVDLPLVKECFLSDDFSKVWIERQIIKQDAHRSVSILRFTDDKEYLVKASENTYLNRCKIVLGVKPSGKTVLARMLAIKAAGVSIPQPLASIVFASPESLELQVMEYLPKAVTLHACITRLLNEDLSAINQLVKAVLSELVILHRIGRIHGDMKLNNVILARDSIFLVDIDGRLAKKNGRLFQKDLARFLVGLIEVKAPQEVCQSVVKAYAEAMDINDEYFFDGVRGFVKKIMKRHSMKNTNLPENTATQ